jgi:hypothetical protein
MKLKPRGKPFVKGVGENSSTRFRPGQSGNPGGRPRKRPISERYAVMVETQLPKDVCRKLNLPEGATYGDALAMGQVNAAMRGDTSAAREIREAVEGKVTARHEISGPDGGPVKMNHEDMIRKIREIYGLNYPEDRPGPTASKAVI